MSHNIRRVLSKHTYIDVVLKERNKCVLGFWIKVGYALYNWTEWVLHSSYKILSKSFLFEKLLFFLRNGQIKLHLATNCRPALFPCLADRSQCWKLKSIYSSPFDRPYFRTYLEDIDENDVPTNKLHMACGMRICPHNLRAPRFIPFSTIVLGLRLLSFCRKCGPVCWSSLDNII